MSTLFWLGLTDGHVMEHGHGVLVKDMEGKTRMQEGRRQGRDDMN